MSARAIEKPQLKRAGKRGKSIKSTLSEKHKEKPVSEPGVTKDIKQRLRQQRLHHVINHSAAFKNLSRNASGTSVS